MDTLFDNSPTGLGRPAHALARRTDPQTSKRAADKAVRFGDSHRERILGAMTYAGQPITTSEIAHLSSLTIVQVDRRMHELRKDGLVRLLDDSQRFAVYELVDQ